MTSTNTKFRTCPLCEAMCGLEITLEGQQVTTIKGDKKDPFSRGHICPKAVALKDIHEDPNRLKYPVRKTEEGWKQISWEEAFDEVVSKFQAIQAKYGDNAVATYNGNPTVHNYGSMLFSPNFIRALKTKNRFSATSVDQLPHHLAGMTMFGHPMMMPVPDIDHTDFWLIMGANPIASNGSIMTAPDVANRLKAIQERGGKIVVIDPRYTETASKADQHIFIKPATDVWLLLGLIRGVLVRDWVDLKHLKNSIDAAEIEQLKLLVSPFHIGMVAQRTGIEEETIRQLMKEFAEAPSAVCYGRMGVSTVKFGGLSQWLINVLNILTGNFDTKGGAMFASPAFEVIRPNQKAEMKFDRWKSRVRGLPEHLGEMPSATLAEEILTEGEGQIRGMFTCCGNPVLSTPNGTQLDKAFRQLDFMVSMDIYINETTRHADIILPPATGLEVGHYDVTFHYLAVRNTAKFSQPVLEKAEGTKYDWEIFSELTKRLLGMSASQKMPLLTPEMIIGAGLKSGPYDLTLQDLKDNPHGVDLGSLQSGLPNRLLTENKKIKLIPDIFAKDLERLLQQMPVRMINVNCCLLDGDI
ncbi:MAG: molybdopterin-dependent oxidoreductase [Chitinophagales bacterium]